MHRPVVNRFKIQASRARIQALGEGARDVMNTSITQAGFRQQVVDKNNYKTYAAQLAGTYAMYDGRADYGGELLRGLIDTRVSLIGGEGLSFTAENKATEKWIEQFFARNHLDGFGLLRMIKMGEMEGRILSLLKKINDEIKIIPYSAMKNNYDFEFSPDYQDIDYIKSATVKQKGNTTEGEKHSIDSFNFMRLGGSENNFYDTSTKIHVVLTDVENYSRAKYDLRRNGFLFGRYTPVFKTENMTEAKQIKNDINAGNWQIGVGYAGNADYKLIGPDSGGYQLLIQDMLASLRTIATTTGIPVHWLSWPDLMSNRATAENMLEMVNAGTIQERLLYEEGFTDLINKARIMAIDAGFTDNKILGEFEVKLSFASLATLKQIVEIWIPLMQADVVSMFGVQNRLPGIDPGKENRLIEKERKERAERSPLNNTLVNEEINKAQNKNREDDNGKSV
jgi:hypothetical protein